ncbi:MAG: transporter substrate-binding domain-containing protein [Pseudomonadota bacterium]|nr:transporter substrate-binding domain-containing protein [Pseudomonadota bacterium]
MSDIADAPARGGVPGGRPPTRRVAWWLRVLALGLTLWPVWAHAERPLVVGAESDLPPLSVGTTEANVDGFTVELWRAVAREQGLEFKLRVRTSEELLKEFKAGEVDVLLNFAKADDRRKFADFSATHVALGGAIFVRAGDPGIHAESDLAGKSIIVLRGDLANDFAISKGWRAQLVQADTIEQGLRLLASGHHDAMLLSKLPGLLTMRARNIEGVVALDVKLRFQERYAFAVQKGAVDLLGRLDEGLAVAKSNGTDERLYDKFFGPYETRAPSWRELAWPSVWALLLLVAAWSVWFRRRLRRDQRNAAVLRDSEERWKFALEGAGDGVWDTDLVAGRTFYSRRWKEILGLAEEEIGTSPTEWEARIHPDDLERVRREHRDCIDAKAEHFFSEFRMRSKDGRWVWVLYRGKVVERSSDGRALRMIGTQTDITARKAAATREADRSRVMTLIASGSPLAVTLDSIVRANEAWSDWRCSLMLTDGSGARLLVGAAPSLPEFFTQALEGMGIGADQGCCGRAAYTRERVLSEDVRTDPHCAAWRDVAARAGLQACWSEPVLGADGALLGTFASYRDRPSLPTAADIERVVDAAHIAAIAIERERANQALRESEAQLSAKSRTLEVTLERMEEGVMMVNADQVVEVCNRRAIELLDLPAEMMRGRPAFDQVLDYQRATSEFSQTPDELRGHFRSGAILDSPQLYERTRPNGRVIEIRSVPIEGGGVLRTYSDITERKRGEAARRHLESQLLEARKLEAIGTLAGGIAHDFNNIMAAILGNAGLARDHLLEGDPAQPFLAQITKAGQRARSLVQQILAFSRRQPSELRSVRVSPLVEETVAMLRSMAGPRARMRVVLPDRQLAVMADPTQLQQILMNLGTNALHALPEGAGQIDFGVDEQHCTDPTSASGGLAPGTYARLWVRDDGRGMDDLTRQRIFEPFFTTKPIGRGTGLGLAVVHGIVTTLHGAIQVTSAPGQGSTFELFLPLVDHESQPVPLDAQETPPVRGHGQHVVYIDDDEVMAVMVQGLLQRLGYRATYYLEAQQAIEAIAADPNAVDLVVTDFNMPHMSGLDVVRSLADVKPGLPIVISSGYVSDELRISADALGVRTVMQKERTVEELGAVAHWALDPSGRRPEHMS